MTGHMTIGAFSITFHVFSTVNNSQYSTDMQSLLTMTCNMTRGAISPTFHMISGNLKNMGRQLAS